MAYFIRTARRLTNTKYLIEAENADEAIDKDGEYLGYVDQDDFESEDIGPFETREAALDTDIAYVEGR